MKIERLAHLLFGLAGLFGTRMADAHGPAQDFSGFGDFDPVGEAMFHVNYQRITNPVRMYEFYIKQRLFANSKKIRYSLIKLFFRYL